MTDKIKIMLVEDNESYRNVIIRALKRDPDMEIASQFGTAEIALRSIQDQSKANTPDLVLLDLNLPGTSGLDALPWFKKYAPSTKVIILTQSDNSADVLKAISHGIDGYLLKSTTAKQIKEGIKTVMAGGASLDSEVALFMLKAMERTSIDPESELALTEREQEILHLLSEGSEKKEIAEELKISRNTVAFHVKQIYIKMEVPNAAAAISKAYRSGLLD